MPSILTAIPLWIAVFAQAIKSAWDLVVYIKQHPLTEDRERAMKAFKFQGQRLRAGLRQPKGAEGAVNIICPYCGASSHP